MGPRLHELQLFRLQQESKFLIPATNERENPPKKSSREKRKLSSHSTEEQAPPAKHHKNMSQNSNRTIENEEVQARRSADLSEPAELDDKNAERVSNQESQDKSSTKSSQFNDQCTAFISNLNLQACRLLLLLLLIIYSNHLFEDNDL